MIIQAAALGCALLLSQVEGSEAVDPPDTSEAEHQQPNPTGLTLALEEPRPALRYDQPVVCAPLFKTTEVPSGYYRMQCDAATRRCLVAPFRELDPEGVETQRPLLRTSACLPAEKDAHTLAAEGYRFVPAFAEAPPGWYRDERGRVMQFNFDLHRRIWLGGAWAPLFGGGRPSQGDRLRVDFGIQTEFPGGDDDDRLHRLTFLETEAYLGAPGLNVTALRYDVNVERTVPLFRITTFFGKPRRIDVGLNLGAWVEVMRQESIERGDAELSLLTWGAAHGTLDLWHSRDLSSYIRVRAGPALERDRTHGLTTLVPTVALEGDLTLDTDGLHHLRFAAEGQKVLLSEAVAGRPLRPERVKLRAGYELILLAINDQPVSLVVDGRGVLRNDIPNLDTAWEWSAQTGLRVSLWAPARRNAPQASMR